MAICTCQQCSLWTYKDADNVFKPGRKLKVDTIKGHVEAERQKRAMERESRAEVKLGGDLGNDIWVRQFAILRDIRY